jgi:hypothetical protein
MSDEMGQAVAINRDIAAVTATQAEDSTISAVEPEGSRTA